MEHWDIYDENMSKTGRTMKRDDWSMKPGEYHVQVLGIIRRPDGKYLITQRKRDKKWAPLAWEFPGGAVAAGEEIEDAVRREVGEETAVDLSDVKAQKALTYKREDPDDAHNYFMVCYEFELDLDESMVAVQEEEVEGFIFADARKIGELASEGRFLHYDSIKSVLS